MTIEPTFAKEDVWAVARAVIGDWQRIYEHGRNECMFCIHCDVSIYTDWSAHEADAKRFPHKLTCAVLRARDLLTGAPS